MFLYNLLLNNIDNTTKIYQTAIKTESIDEFNYTVDTKQGNVLAYGKFNVKNDNLVKFDEMNKKFPYVKRNIEEYTQHTETYSCGESTCTRTYYSWDYDGSEELKPKTINFMNRNYDGNVFSYDNTRGEDASNIANSSSGKYYYPDGNNWFTQSVGDKRYSYEVTDNNFMGSIFINTYGENIKSFDSKKLISIKSGDIQERVNSANKKATLYKVLFWIISVIVTTALIIGTIYMYSNYR